MNRAGGSGPREARTSLDRTVCEVVALDARHPDIGLTPVTVVTEDGRAGMYLANDRELETMTAALADASVRVTVITDLLITGLELSAEQEER